MNTPIKDSVFYLSQIAVSGLLSLILIPIITKYLSPTEMGQFVISQVYTLIGVGIANFGMLLSYERNFFIYEKSRDDTAKLINSAIIFVFFNLIILFSTVYLFQIQISNLILSDKVNSNLLIIVLIGSMFLSLSQYYLTFLKNSRSAKSYAKYLIGNSTIYFCFAVIFMSQLGLGVMSLAYSWVLSNIILYALLFFKLRKILPFDFDMEMLKEMLKISIPLTPRILFGFMNTQLDKILLGLIGSSGLVGIYHVGQTFAVIIFRFMTGLEKVFQPELYRKLFANKHLKGSFEINNFILPFFYVSIFVALIILLFSKELVLLFLSNEYQQSAPIIAILSIFYSSLFFGKITGNQLIYAKKTYLITLLTPLGIGINFSLNFPFITIWGVLGAAWATTISGIIITVVSVILAQRYTKITWKWKSFFLIYGVFITATLITMIDYSFTFNLYIILTFKLLILFFYIIIGYILKIVHTKDIKDAFKTL